jgi:hypothetical protein
MSRGRAALYGQDSLIEPEFVDFTVRDAAMLTASLKQKGFLLWCKSALEWEIPTTAIPCQQWSQCLIQGSAFEPSSMRSLGVDLEEMPESGYPFH